MIDPKELRVGNLLHYTNEEGWTHVVEVVTVGKYFFYAEGDEIYPPLKCITYSPIPLTPEILGKCGFVDGIIKLPFGKKLCIGSANNGTCIAYFGEQSETLSRYCEHVHQLQNLFFTLTGEELEIKPF